MGGKLDVGDTLGEVFSIYRDQAGVLLPIAFWLFLAVAIVDGLSRGNFALFPLVVVVSTVAGTLYEGMVVNLVRGVRDGLARDDRDRRSESSMGDLVRSAMPFLLPLIGAGVLSGIAIGIGLVAFVVPGLFLITIWAVIAPVIVIERRGVMEAFGRSRQLVRGYGWPVLGTVLVGYLIAVIGGVILNSIAVSIADGPLVRIVFSAIASTVTAPIVALVAAVLYYRLRGLEAAAIVAPAEPSAPDSLA
jgi:hypothetical protein